MTHFAQIDSNNIVVQVIVAEQDFIDSGVLGDPRSWLKTSYNTKEGIYYEPNSDQPADQTKAFRKNYAGIGYTYDHIRDAFIPPKPFESWLLDEFSCTWYPPKPIPADGKEYVWNEESQEWLEKNK